MRVVRDPGMVEDSLRAYHAELVAAIIGDMDTDPVGRVVELGSGTGLFTVPLLEALRDGLEVMYCVDPFTGPYRSSRTVLESKIASLGLGERVEILEVDATEVGRMIGDVDLVAGHEVLCDLDAKTVRRGPSSARTLISAMAVTLDPTAAWARGPNLDRGWRSLTAPDCLVSRALPWWARGRRSGVARSWLASRWAPGRLLLRVSRRGPSGPRGTCGG